MRKVCLIQLNNMGEYNAESGAVEWSNPSELTTVIMSKAGQMCGWCISSPECNPRITEEGVVSQAPATLFEI